ncbi:MAG: hypothetical protein LUI87_11635 [Lachnospiraceae bacterium]|nr:hypothetical protein [Lachnospiraceae bacterium]
MSGKKNLRKFFVTLSAMFLLIFTMSLTSMAASKTVASIGSTNYTSLSAALKKVKNGETITLKANVTQTSALNINRDKSFTLNLNGKKITFSSGKTMKIKSGTVTITGTGTITGSGIVVSEGAVLNIKKGTYKQYIESHGTTNISGGTIKGNSTYGTCISNSGKLKITAGTFTASGKRDIIDSEGTVTIIGGTFTSTSTYNMLSNWGSGTMTIKGGTFSNTKDQMVCAWDNAVTTITGGTS